MKEQKKCLKEIEKEDNEEQKKRKLRGMTSTVKDQKVGG